MSCRFIKTKTNQRKPIMKVRIPIIVVASVCSLFLTLPSGFSQGILTPPGTPEPGMKTLQQVEPRTDVLTLPTGGAGMYLISQPGSYYLTTDIICWPVTFMAGIEIATSNVTLDLNGFAILGPGDETAGDGIDLDPGVTDVMVSNGTISGCANGVWGSWCFNCRFERLLLSDNTQQGMLICQQCQVVNCLARNNAYSGFFIRDGTCTDCKAEGNYTGIVADAGGVLLNCVASRNSLDGIVVSSNCLVQGCLANNNTRDGIRAASYNTITGCTVSGNGNSGMEVTNACTIVNNTANQNSLNGIHVCFGTANRIDSNHAMQNGSVGIKIDSTGSQCNNLAVRNTAGGTDADHQGFSFGDGTTYGPIIRVDHTSGGPITTPATGWENFQWHE
jgi:parallel beta-helix repeat protein